MTETSSANLQSPDSLRIYRRLFGYLLPYRWTFLGSLLFMAMTSVTEPLFAGLMKPLIDINFGGNDATPRHLVPLALVGLMLMRGVGGFLNEYSTTWLAGRLVQDLRNEMFDHLVRLPSSYFDRNPTGAVVSRFIYDVTMVTEAGFNIITISIKDSLTVLFLLGLLIYYDWQLTLVCLGVIPPLLLSIRAASRRLRRLSQQGQVAMGQVAQIINETSANQRIVKIFGGSACERAHFAERCNHLRQILVKQTAASAANSGLVQVLIAIALAVIIYFASFRAAQGNMTAGMFVSYMTAMLMLFAPVKRLTGVNTSLQKGLVAAESVFRFLDEATEADGGRHRFGTPPAGDLRFERVRFRYAQGNQDALADVDLHLPAGKTVALVGVSGGGKSTLAGLIPRLYEIGDGRILLDGVDLRDIPLVELRRHIAIVTQDVNLFDDTVAANIAYGDLAGTSREQIATAARQAHALEFIEQLPHGFDSQVGEKGLRLSGGQKQRLAIARAFLKNAPILILDEATSALDNESERQVQAALETLTRNRTTLIIAHRLSTIEHADTIVVMQEGRVAEVGGHAELLARNGVYSGLYRSTLLPASKEAG
ncbi:MAG: lipid A export permease/ATP-binding protein MsbA [Sterolibacterium sp.]